MIIARPSLCTKLVIWSPKYSTKWESEGEWVVLLAKYKVHRATPVIIVVFTKAKHLLEQRFAIRRKDVEKCPIVSNGQIDCYKVKMSQFEDWVSHKDVLQDVEAIGW